MVRRLDNVVTDNSRVGRLVLTIIFCLIAIFQSGLRNISTLPDGNDTPVYEHTYYWLKNTSWESILNGFSFYGTEYDGRDVGYEVFMKFTQLFSGNFIFFMFLTAVIFLVPFSMLIYKYVKSYLGIILAFLVYFALFTNIVNSFMRQAVALGVILFAIRYIQNRNWKMFFLLMAFVPTIHSSAIVATPLYFLPKFCKTEKWLRLALFSVPVLMIFQQTIYAFLLTGTVYEDYVSAEKVSPMNYMLLLGFIAVLSLIYYKDVKKTKDYEILISGVIGSALLFPVLLMGNSMLRISYYYVIFLIPLLSVILDRIDMANKMRVMIYILAICVFSYFMFR